MQFILGYDDQSLEATYTSPVGYFPKLDVDRLNVNYITAVARISMKHHPVTDIKISLKNNTDIGCLAVCNHNFGPDGTIQWKVFSDSAHTNEVYDSGEIPVGAFNDSIDLKNSVHAVSIDEMAKTRNAGYLQLLVNNGHNFIDNKPVEFYEIGSLFIGKRFIPSCNMEYGLQHEVDDSFSRVFRSDNGIDSFVEAPEKRGVVFSLGLQDYLTGDEYYALTLKSGVTRRIMYQFDDTDNHKGLYTFLATMKSLSPLKYPSFARNNMGFALQEIT